MTVRTVAHVTLGLPIEITFCVFTKVVPIHSTNTPRVQIPGSPLEVLPIFRTCSDEATGRLTTWSSDSGHFGILFFVCSATFGPVRAELQKVSRMIQRGRRVEYLANSGFLIGNT
jgi:hypothetical protein